MKNESLIGFITRLEWLRKESSRLEDISIETSKTETQQEKEN